jgi:F5/8 type C domain
MPQRERSFQTWIKSFDPGIAILIAAIALVFVRYSWICFNRPAHRQEIADAYSIRLFYGAPQIDSRGHNATFVGTSDTGFAVFLVDSAKRIPMAVKKEDALGEWGHFFDLQVWPWAPDDTAFIYTAGHELDLCRSETGETIASLDLPTEVASLAWLTPDKFVFIGKDEAFYRIEKQTDGQWNINSTLHPDRATASTENYPKEAASKAFDGRTNTKWYNNSRPQPWWLEYAFGDGRRTAVNEYDLTSGNDFPQRDPTDWQFQGSNDGSNWVTLDSHTGETFSARLQTKSYLVSNKTAYQRYRLKVTKNNGGEEFGLQLSEFSLKSTNARGQANDLNLQRNPFADAGSLMALSEDNVAWAQEDKIWTLDGASTTPDLLLDFSARGMPDCSLQGFSYSKASGQFLLNCVNNQKLLLYRFSPNNQNAEFQPTKLAENIQDAVWLNSRANDRWIGRQGTSILFGSDAHKESDSTLSRVKVDAFTMTSDSKQIFFLGTIGNEPSAGIWQYDVSKKQLHCVVPYAEHPSNFARKIEPVNDFILSDSGKYTVYLPADFYKHRHRKYPLVLGDTDFGFAMRGEYGRMWAPSIAACNAFVIIVNRPDWFNRIDKWGEDVTTALERFSSCLPIDTHRVYLFGVSAETTPISEFLKHSPERWRGVMLLNPTGLPDLAGTSSFRQMPKLLISVGGLEGLDERLKTYQAAALKEGMIVNLVIAPGEKHHLVGNAAQRQRTTAMLDFIFR